MKITYDKEADVLYIRFTESRVFESEEKQPNVVFDYDKEDNVVGIEITYFLERNKKDVFPALKDMEMVFWGQLQAVS